jgi:hypothetical protein
MANEHGISRRDVVPERRASARGRQALDVDVVLDPDRNAVQRLARAVAGDLAIDGARLLPRIGRDMRDAPKRRARVGREIERQHTRQIPIDQRRGCQIAPSEALVNALDVGFEDACIPHGAARAGVRLRSG